MPLILKSLPDHLQEKLDNLSREPGVYLYKDKNGNIIYIGKAKVLRNRVRSYFQHQRTDSKTMHLLSRIDDIETIITDTEVEALILEANLVKEHKPRYNINLKDDKSFPYLRVTNEPYPRIFPTRKVIRDGSRYFGPYTNVIAMKALLATIKKIFPVRSCSLPLNEKTIAAHKFKVCLNYHIHRCSGPCEGHVSQEEYQQTIDYIVEFIQGNTARLERDIKARMYALSEERRFEEAARLRDQLQSITMFSERQKVLDNNLADRDIIATAVDEDDACCVVLRVREGKIISKDHFFMEHTEGENVAAITKAFLQQFYLKAEDVPAEVLASGHFGDDHLFLEEWLSQKNARRVRLLFPQRGEKERLLQMCVRNAKHHLDELKLKKMQSKEYVAGSVRALQKALQLDHPPQRIEGFDISNIQGTDPVASMVCFINGRAAKGEYRRYKIRIKQSPDDFAMMNEVVKRRYARQLREKKTLPDLILIDGGKGQLNAACTALRDLGLDNQPVIALAKRLDEIYRPGISAPQNLPRDSAALRLLQRVRDESHRFALTFHRARRKQRTLLSDLDSIPGIGVRRKSDLLRHFQSMDNIKAASVDELAIGSISARLAAIIYAHLHREESEGA
ncbi:excinuclease ABC subunit C [candidate division KSB1 bacterium]|nr:excinuclease ABC subunit C [candidate division KSB1 bacterium]